MVVTTTQDAIIQSTLRHPDTILSNGAKRFFGLAEIARKRGINWENNPANSPHREEFGSHWSGLQKIY